MTSQDETIDHDKLFKLLLLTFFMEFLQLFFPQVLAYLDLDSLKPLDKEVFTDLTEGERHEADLIMQARFKPAALSLRQLGQLQGRKPSRKQSQQQQEQAYFLIHVEAQSTASSDFSRRMFIYFSRLYEKYNQPVYPVAIFSYDEPFKAARHQHSLRFPNKKVLEFDYDIIQLNRLDWRNFVNTANPVASALMAKMHIAPQDRPTVKAECIAMLLGLKLNEARTELVRGFVESYLRLNPSEEREFETELYKRVAPQEKERVMQALDLWTRRGLEQGRVEGRVEGRAEGRVEGRAEGRVEGELRLVLRQLKRKLGQELPTEVEQQITVLPEGELTDLGEAMLAMTTLSDLTAWLARSL